jgi:hypothetical protein
MNTNPLPRKTLADIIMEKITEKQTEIQSQFSEADSNIPFNVQAGGKIFLFYVIFIKL